MNNTERMYIIHFCVFLNFENSKKKLLKTHFKYDVSKKCGHGHVQILRC